MRAALVPAVCGSDPGRFRFNGRLDAQHRAMLHYARHRLRMYTELSPGVTGDGYSVDNDLTTIHLEGGSSARLLHAAHQARSKGAHLSVQTRVTPENWGKLRLDNLLSVAPDRLELVRGSGLPPQQFLHFADSNARVLAELGNVWVDWDEPTAAHTALRVRPRSEVRGRRGGLIDEFLE